MPRIPKPPVPNCHIPISASEDIKLKVMEARLLEQLQGDFIARNNIKTINKILENCPKSYLKFVVNPETWDADYAEIIEILSDLPTYAEVYLMPMGETRELQIKNTPFVFEKRAEHGFSFSPRAHILAFNTKEGI